MARVFLSHVSADKAMARRIADALRVVGHQPWIDEDDILVGESIPAAVERGLREADFVVLCLSKAAAERGWVEAERDATLMQQFRDRKARILPVRLEDVAPPYLIAAIAYVDLFPDDQAFSRGIARLTSSIAAHATRLATSGDTGAVSSATAADPGPPAATGVVMNLPVRAGVAAADLTGARRMRVPAVIAGGVALVAAGIAGVAWRCTPSPGKDEAAIEMVRVPGSTDVAPFWIAKTELTQAAWQGATGGNPSDPQFGIGPRYPVNRITWDEAITTANALSRKRGWSPCYARVADAWQSGACTGYRLVTDVEWNHLMTLRPPAAAPCAAGNLADQALLARRPQLVTLLRQAVPQFAVVDCDDHYDGLAEVGSFAADALGIHDLDGNVAEWIWNGTASRPATRAVRGSWFLGPGARDVLPPSDALGEDHRDATIGVRYAKAVP